MKSVITSILNILIFKETNHQISFQLVIVFFSWIKYILIFVCQFLVTRTHLDICLVNSWASKYIWEYQFHVRFYHMLTTLDQLGQFVNYFLNQFAHSSKIKNFHPSDD